MKRFIIATLALCVVMTIPMSAADNAVSVNLNGEAVTFTGQQPVIVENRTLIPLRGVFEKMGYSVEWEANTKTALLTSGDTSVSVSANSSQFIVNGQVKSLDVPAQILNGSMMLPLRAIGESAGANVTWNGATKTVEISTDTVNAEDIVSISDYFASYSDAIAPLSTVQELCNELQSVDGEISKEQLLGYKERLSNALITMDTVKSAVSSLSVPDSAAELHSIRLEAIDKLSELVNLLIDYCDGKISNDELTDKINTLSTEVTEITKENNRIFEELSSELTGK